MRNERHHIWAIATLALGLVVACGGDDDHDDHEEHGVEEEFCEHFENGPFESVSATSDAVSAPDATFEHTRVNVTLTSTTGGMGGWIHFEVAEAGEVVIATSPANVPMRLVHADHGEEVTAEKTEANDLCEEVASQATYDVEVGRYDVWFGPTAASEVAFGFEGGEHGEDHDHEHE